MPIYEYRCGSCGKRSTALLASYSAPDPACPHCDKPTLRRLVSTFATVRPDSGGENDWNAGGDDQAGDGDSPGDEGDFGDGDFGGDDY